LICWVDFGVFVEMIFLRFICAMLRFLFSIVFAFILMQSSAQSVLKPGFDALEYEQSLMANFRYTDSAILAKGVNAHAVYQNRYTSPEVGLKNQWSLWTHPTEKIALISLRGTIPDPVSWLANLYAAMIPAKGVLQLNDSTSFSYCFSKDSNAYVHVGWTVALGHLAADILEKLKKVYQEGYRDVIIVGHSQGGGLAFLTSSFLQYHDEVPKDIRFKTYCSAAPKPGNLYYAYDFEFLNRGGWAFRVVNRADWVPEVPFSVQGLDDFNQLNPFVDIRPALKKQGALQRYYLTSVYKKMDRRTRKAADTFQKYLGDLVDKQVHKTLPQFQKPRFANSNNYTVAGQTIVLMPDSLYHEKFVDNGKNVFLHHMGDPYLYLLKRQYQ
jgi:hypothetical protein